MVLTNIGSKLVLLTLVGLSIWSVSIMIDRYRAFKLLKEKKDSKKPRELIEAKDWQALSQWSSAQTGHVLGGALKAALSGGNEALKIDRAVRSYLSEEKVKLEKGFTVLATLGSNAPFIGLFGTVLGIIQAFGMLSSAAGGSTSVMSGIAEALIATAVGLFVAIPAVVAYNVFTRELRLVLVECEALKDLYISRIGDHSGS